ncbi:MAG: fused MFS/spermidine synthase [Nitrospirae bacterium]|nr:fused MFS/spermidine synthase [Nitrospirota bacterium]
MKKNSQQRADFVLLLLTIFICGMIVLVLEVLGSRILSPYFGISLFIWTSLITVTLISLSLGYWIGGILSDRYQNRDLFYLLVLVSGIFVMMIPLIQKPVSLAMTSFGPRMGCLTTAFILFTVPLTLLGMVAPFSLKLSLREIDRAGKIAGNLYALSTLGGIMGTLLVGFWLIPNLGLKNILFVISISLSIFPAIHFVKTKNWKPALACLSVIFISGVLIIYFSQRTQTGKIIFKSESYYGQLKVLDNAGIHMLMVDGAIQTAYQTGLHQSLAPYTGMIEEVLKACREKSLKKVFKGAVIGLGGGVIPESEFKSGDLIDIVEIDPRMPMVAKKFFEFHPERFNLILEDARHFLNGNRKKYDYIVLDVFAGESSPFYLLSRECFEQLRNSLTDDGILVMNTIGLFTGEGSEFTQSIYKTLQQNFSHRAVLTVSLKDNFTNYIMLASNRPLGPLIASSGKLFAGEVHLREDSGHVLTDDYNPADYLEQQIALEWRLAIWRGTGSEILLD